MKNTLSCERCGGGPLLRRGQDVYGAVIGWIGSITWALSAFGLLATMVILAIIGITAGFQAFFGSLSLAIIVSVILIPLALIGVFFARRKKIWKCKNCGTSFPR